MMGDKPVKTGETEPGEKGSRRESAIGKNTLHHREGSRIGNTAWVIPGGRIPLRSNGGEPMFTSRDRIILLNACSDTACVRITIYFGDMEPVGPFPLSIGPGRVRHVRINDLIFPQAVPLETDYAALILSDLPIVVQFGRMDTRQRENAGMTAIAFPDDD